MKKHYTPIILTALALTLGLSVSAAAAGPASTAPDDLDSYLLAHTTGSDGARSLPIDRSEVNEQAITGYILTHSRTVTPPAVPSSSMPDATRPCALISP